MTGWASRNGTRNIQTDTGLLSRCWTVSIFELRLSPDPGPMNDKIDTESFKDLNLLRQARISHRDLDDLIDRLAGDPLVDQLRIRRLKKKRLVLKDMIARLESELIPDLDA